VVFPLNVVVEKTFPSEYGIQGSPPSFQVYTGVCVAVADVIVVEIALVVVVDMAEILLPSASRFF
jgi:tetrahydromethanopterin S-methyltransferase subunit E